MAVHSRLPLKVYTASSWRNQKYGQVVSAIRAEGFDVYDFRHTWDADAAFNWDQIDKDWESWSADTFRKALEQERKVRKIATIPEVVRIIMSDYFKMKSGN